MLCIMPAALLEVHRVQASVTELDTNPHPEKTVIYARVSNGDRRTDLDKQGERLVHYCQARGYQIHRVYQEIGSGINDNRRQFKSMLSDDSITRIVVEHKDRLTRFGFNTVQILLQQRGCDIEVVNLADDGKEDLLEDLTAIIYSFCTRLYNQRRAKRKTEHITEALYNDDATG